MLGVSVYSVALFVEANTAGTSVEVVVPVTISAEVPCTPENSSYSEVCMDLDDDVIQVENIPTPSIFARIWGVIKFW